ncbi:hypothetical protein GQ43DRAFT_28567 [Delitschia confertaspora ATCC 74209]|uniref:F-box domain-containing protein n=1 Tax=Delitschia confertaspora ATCC 74209 TaxID=1513339 RepID=A0A9P4JSC8_9PLEO|nr:hypothetical protein GQ43DRAFT_28567 [Delitschia confertaspora ATCC 74209]
MAPKANLTRRPTGDTIIVQSRNKGTGRPVRANAGKKKVVIGFVDSGVIEESDHSVDTCSEDDEGNPRQHKKKRKRSPSPSPPPLDPIIYDEKAEAVSEDETTDFLRRRSPVQPVTFTFNIPLGFHGPLVVKLDPILLSGSGKVEGAHLLLQGCGEAQGTAPQGNRKGFTDLPPEIRNKIYRSLFVLDGDVRLLFPQNLCASSAFLRTCKLVHNEGCSILYGENKFHFQRNRAARAPFWEPTPKEIGYKDVRQFLNMIGPANLTYLRDIRFDLEDALLATTHYLTNQEERRYINDAHLIECLRILRLSRLQKFAIGYMGRRCLSKMDTKFIHYLRQVRADEVDSNYKAQFRYISHNKVHADLAEDLVKSMTRTTKLYAKDAKN